ncbi:hypothetical protein SmJEL517_g03867 [Synchytrium microbalum]|uniref:ARID domain-containing protein n=1 Tax=Synchytrium microbalum TaxID=1806994 RepID=A0A507C1E2_9FUNG|nr:uncharacterized protein SmJEL517_g03867 [Synchytrium microbalum]TPX33241.1 hypothetical protein SmJEL517_g03867 [Synchytrium microbalum]
MDSIERTPDYTKFIHELEKFHNQIGTTFVKEPILGGKKIDLFKIYKATVEAGGHEKVSSQKGWKKIADLFNLPSTCTNSAFVIKQVYAQALAHYELHKKRGGPSVDAIKKMVTEQNSLKRGADTELNGVGIGEPVNGIKLEEGKKRKVDQGLPTTKPVVPRPMTLFLSGDEEPFDGVSMFDLKVAPVFLLLTLELPLDRLLLFGGPHSRLLLALESGLPNEIDWAFNKLIKISFRSYNSIKPIDISNIPGLLHILLTHMAPVFGRINLDVQARADAVLAEPTAAGQLNPLPPLTEITIFASTDQLILFERALQSLLVINNFTFYIPNIKNLVESDHLLSYLTKGIALPSSTLYIELKRYCLTILEEMSEYLDVSKNGRDYIVTYLEKLVHSNDLGLILPALRILNQLAMQDKHEEVFSNPSPEFMKRLMDLLLTPHEEVIHYIMDHFYHLSSLGGDTARAIVGGDGISNSSGARLRMLLRMLFYSSKRQKAAAAAQAQKVASAGRPTAQNLLQNWIRSWFAHDPASSLSHQAIIGLAEKFCADKQVKLQPTEVITAFKQHFPAVRDENGSFMGLRYQSTATLAPMGGPPTVKINAPNTIVDIVGDDDTDMAEAGLEFLDFGKNLDAGGEGASGGSKSQPALQTPPNERIELSGAGGSNSNATTPGPSSAAPMSCWWGRTSTATGAPSAPQDASCNGPFDTDADVLAHIVSKHIQPDMASPLLTCQWRTCDYVCPTDDRQQLFAHVKTHTPFRPPASSNSKPLASLLLPSTPAGIGRAGSIVLPPQSDNLLGVPLTTLYVLRNMARAGVDLAAIEQDLIKWADAHSFPGVAPSLLYESLRVI